MDHNFWRWHKLDNELLLDYVFNIAEIAKREGEFGGGGLDKLARSVLELNSIHYNDGIHALNLEGGFSVRNGETVIIDWSILLSKLMPHIKISFRLLKDITVAIQERIPNATIEIKDIFSDDDQYIAVTIFNRTFKLWIGRRRLGDDSIYFPNNSAINMSIGEYHNRKDGNQDCIIENAMHDLILAQIIYPLILDALSVVTASEF